MRIEDAAFRPSEVFAVASQVNAIASAAVAAQAGKRFMITGVLISASAAPAATVSVTVVDGSTTIDQLELPAAAFAPIVINYVRPLRCAVNSAATVSAPALGAGVRGTVTIRGYFTNE